MLLPQAITTTGGAAADAGAAASRVPVRVPAAATSPAASMTRARMSFMGVLLRLDPVTYTTPGLGRRIKRALSRSCIGQRLDGHLPQPRGRVPVERVRRDPAPGAGLIRP